GQQMRLGEYLEAVADAKNRTANAREFLDRRHHRREASDGSCPERVPIGEAAGEHNRIDSPEGGFAKVDHLGIHTDIVVQRADRVVISVAAVKPDHRDSGSAHAVTSASLYAVTLNISMTVLASSCSHMRSTSAIAAAWLS